MALESFELLRRSEEGHFWFTTRNQLIEWLIRRYVPTAARAFEIGCGTGFVLKAFRSALPRTDIAGSELHSRGLIYALNRHLDHAELIQMDARQTFLSEVFELVGAFDVLEHIDEDELVLAEIYRMLRPKGVFIASVPQHPWLWSAVDEIGHHRRRYRRGELAAKARKIGFRIRYQTSFATLAFPMLVADRLRSGMRSDLKNADVTVPPVVNHFLIALFRVEHMLRRLGMPLPFGGSQIIVADKV
jgi:SAM-dependent methyltransferase